MRKIKILFFFACIIILFLSGCSADTETIPTATMDFSDNNGISFSMTVTPCTNNKSNGNISIYVQNSTDILQSACIGSLLSVALFGCFF